MQNTQLTTLPPLPTVIAERNIDHATYSALKNSIFPGASDESIAFAVDYCVARKMDIMKKPCHIVPMNVKDAKTGQYEWRDIIMPGIAEVRITANRTEEYAGTDAPIFGATVSVKFGNQTHEVPEFCTVTVYRMKNGMRCGTSHTEYFEEAANTTKDGSLNSMWTKRKRGQLAKCAEAGALRKAFPEESGGMITADEIEPDFEPQMRDANPKRQGLANVEPIKPHLPAPAQAEAKSESESPLQALPQVQWVAAKILKIDGRNVTLQGSKEPFEVTATNDDVISEIDFLGQTPAEVQLQKVGRKFILCGVRARHVAEQEEDLPFENPAKGGEA